MLSQNIYNLCIPQKFLKPEIKKKQSNNFKIWKKKCHKKEWLLNHQLFNSVIYFKLFWTLQIFNTAFSWFVLDVSDSTWCLEQLVLWWRWRCPSCRGRFSLLTWRAWCLRSVRGEPRTRPLMGLFGNGLRLCFAGKIKKGVSFFFRYYYDVEVNNESVSPVLKSKIVWLISVKVKTAFYI